MPNQEKLKKLADKIGDMAGDEWNDINGFIDNYGRNLIGVVPKFSLPRKYKNISLSDLQKLSAFYWACCVAADVCLDDAANGYKALKRLSSLRYINSYIEDCMSSKFRSLLIKFYGESSG